MIPIDKLPLDTVRELVRLVAAIAIDQRARQFSVKYPVVVKVIQEELARSNIATDESPVSTGLPPRLSRVLPLLLQGMDIQRIAEILNLSKYTVQEYVQDIYRHFGVCRRSQLQALLATRGTRKTPDPSVAVGTPRSEPPAQ
ncbi:MAG: helix-turn-helix transcriptional regulator [Phycisphaerae bacterium]